MEEVVDLPKVELHLHLDCSLSFEVVSKINPGITKDIYESEFIGPPKCSSLGEILKYVTNQVNLMQTEKNLRLVVNDLFDQLQKENVIYAEIRFAPLLHLEKGLKPEEVIEILTDESSVCSNRTGIKTGLILCTLRHFSEKESLQTVKLVEKYINTTLVSGFDIAADEAGYPIDNNNEAFLYAIRKHLPRTAHAGEAKGPESIRETIDNFQPARIGHGVRSVEDPDLVEYLYVNNIHLEVCPTCNIQTNIFNKYEDHPVNYLFNSDVSVGINTDGRTLANVTLSDEYIKLSKSFGWGTQQFKKCNLNAIANAFMPESEKETLKKIINQGYPKD